MKFRSLLLLACMTVVPCTAMFSHRLPDGLPQAFRRSVWEPAVAWVRGSAPTPGVVGECPDQPLRPVVAAALVPGAREATDGIRESDALRARLTQIGAVGVECRPLPGSTGDHVAMCRMPVDAAGHLHRVFQVIGPDAQTAQRRLVVDVEAWLQRTASRPAP
jgi:hypothetical protein